MVPCCSYTFCHYFSLYVKSLALKLTKKMRFFIIFMNVTISDLHGHRRSQVIVQNERQYISSYLSIIVTIGLSGTVTEI